MEVQLNERGQVEVRENGAPVLCYNYGTVEPGEILKQVAEPNLKYARPRSDYIHPLYGPAGEVLTADFPVDHPHHRGIYWGWPETMYKAEMGDLHALQRVFARPNGKLRVKGGQRSARIDAENLWRWEDRETVATERVSLTVFPMTPRGRFVDLTITVDASVEGLSIARRGTNLYGGLNMRMNKVRDQRITFHTDDAGRVPRMAWGEMHGVFEGGSTPVSVVVFQHPANPHYPGDWVQYPELNWFQPTFPAPNTRCELKRGKPLILRYGLWIRSGGPVEEKEARVMWKKFVARNRAATRR